MKILIGSYDSHKLVIETLDFSIGFKEQVSTISLEPLSVSLSLHVIQLFKLAKLCPDLQVRTLGKR